MKNMKPYINLRKTMGKILITKRPKFGRRRLSQNK